jgi:hypothetical protein
VLCSVSGSEGDVVSCPLLVVRADGDVPGPTALGFSLTYTASLLSFQGLSDEPCHDGTCAALAVPPAQLFPSGHNATLTPASPSTWTGAGGVALTPPVNFPDGLLTTATLTAGGGTAGDAEVAEVRFTLQATIESPLPIHIGEVTATGTGDGTLETSWSGNVIVVGQHGEVDCGPDTFPCPMIEGHRICAPTGLAGELFECPVGLARTSKEGELPSTLSLSMHYFPEQLRVHSVVAKDCSAGPCTTLELPGALPSGHLLAATPAALSTWAGTAGITVNNPGRGKSALSTAWLEGSAVKGNAEVFVATFELLRDLGPFTTGGVGVDGLAATSVTGAAMVADHSTWMVTVSDKPTECPPEGCDPPPPAGDGLLCVLTGAKDDLVDCPLRLARISEDAPFGTGLQSKLYYDAERFEFVNFYDETCFEGAGCFELPASGSEAKPLSTGHSVSAAPLTPAKWKGFGAIIVANLSDQTAHITEAYVDPAGQIVGDPLFMLMRFKLLADNAEPIGVLSEEPLAATGESITLPSTVVDGVIITLMPQ